MNGEQAEFKPCYLLEQPENPKVPKCENPSVGPISREVDLAWLAGIIDGEGNLDFSVNKRETSAKRIYSYFQPKVRITNTDVRMILRISKIYCQENLVFFYALNSVKRYKNRKDTWHNQLEITIAHQTTVKKLLGLVIPHLANKRDLAQTMVDCISWIQSQPRRGGIQQSTLNYCDSPVFKEFHERMKSHRQWHIDPSTTIRMARKELAW